MKNRGQALIPVLFVVLILTALAVTMTTTAHREVRAAANQINDTQQYLIARGAIQYAAASLMQATNGGCTYPQLTPPPDTDSNGWTQIGDGWYKVDIIDTSSRVNINIADAATLAKLPPCQTDPSLAANIIDWRDTDDNPTTIQGVTGSESDYYQGLSPAYSAKNAPFDSIEELLLVKGFTPQLLYGVNGQIPTLPVSEVDANGNPISTTRAAKSRQAAGGAGQGASTAIDTTASTTPFSELITTYSKEINYAADGTKRLDVKTASTATLTTLLTNAGVTARDARTLLNTFASQKANVTSLGDLLGKTDGAGGQLVAPWSRAILQKVADNLTVGAAATNDGVLNINTAAPEALATLAGMDQTLYALILQLRQQNTTFTTVNDLFTGSTFTAAQLKTLYGKVCAKSSVYLIRVKVRMSGSARTYAAQAVVELAAPNAATTGQTASQVAQSASNSSSTSAATPPPPVLPSLLQFREVPRSPGWTSWLRAPSLYTNGSSGGSIGSP